MADNDESYDDGYCDITNHYDVTSPHYRVTSSSGRITNHNPESQGYSIFQNDSDFTDDDEDKEFGVELEQRKQCMVSGQDYDESEDAESTASSDDYSCVKVESGSGVLFGKSYEPEQRKLEVSHDYDEEHLAKSSSSETSPRDDFDSANTPIVDDRRVRYSKYTSARLHNSSYSGSSAPAAVDDRITFPNMSTKNSFYGPPYNYRQFNRGANHSSQSNTVRGMAVRSEDVTLQMPDDDCTSSFRPGGSLYKSTSSTHTRDSSPILRGLDKRSAGSSVEMMPLSGMSLQREDSPYGSISSLEHQHPDRSTNVVGSSTSDGATTSRTHLSSGSRGGQSYGSMSAPPSENTELNKKKRRKERKNNMKSNSWTKAEENEVAKMGINDILIFIGEKNVDTETAKKKKDKKENKKDSATVDKKIQRGNTSTASSNNKSKENFNGASKRKQGKPAATDNVPNSQFNVPTSEIIQTNDRLVSRIILNGSDECLDGSESTEKPAYSERNIDEAIEQSKSLSMEVKPIPPSTGKTETAVFHDISPPDETSKNEGIGEKDVELVNQSTSQTVNVTYNIDLASQSFFVEEEFVRIKTPDLVEELKPEEEFKEVVHKKKKGHGKQWLTDKDSTSAAVHTATVVPVITGKVVNKVAVKPKPVVPRPISPHKVMDGLKERSSSVGEMHCDLSEKSFPMLSGDHQPRVATVQPFQNSWAAKVASTSTVQPQMVYNAVGDGDHCSTSKPITLSAASVTSKVAEKMVQSQQENIVESSDIISTDIGISSPRVKVIESVRPVKGSVDESVEVTPEMRLEDSCKTLTVNTVEPFTVIYNVEKSNSAADCLCSPPVSAQTRAPRASKKMTKVVEFVGRSFQENADSSSSNIQFGFGFDAEQHSEPEFEFGISTDILCQTSLKQQIQPKLEPTDVSHVSKSNNPPIDILPRLLASKGPPVDDVGKYPASLRKVVHMLRREWSATLRHLNESTRGQSKGKRRVVRWSPDLI